MRFLSPGWPSFRTNSSSVPDASGPVASKRARIFWMSQATYRNVAVHVVLDDGKGTAAQQVKERHDALRCGNELGRRDTITGDRDGAVGLSVSPRARTFASVSKYVAIVVNRAPRRWPCTKLVRHVTTAHAFAGGLFHGDHRRRTAEVGWAWLCARKDETNIHRPDLIPSGRRGLPILPIFAELAHSRFVLACRR